MKPIPGFPGYFACANGHIWSARSRNPDLIKRKPSLHPTGYLKINLHVDNVKTTHYVHRLVALAWLGPPTAETVNHKNADKLDNRPENLEWAPDFENRMHGRRLGLCSEAKPVEMWVEGKRAGRWPSIQQAAKATGTDKSAIRQGLKRGQKWRRGRKLV